jgi:hypothetical protein
MRQKVVALGLVLTVVMPAVPVHLLAAGGQQNATISGTARKEAKKPYADFTTRARNVQDGQVAGTALLDQDANFSLPGLPPATYVVELLNHDGKVVCTEGPFNLTQQPVKSDVNISCNKVPAAWWLLGAAAAAGVTAGVVTANASPSQ